MKTDEYCDDWPAITLDEANNNIKILSWIIRLALSDNEHFPHRWGIEAQLNKLDNMNIVKHYRHT